MGVESARLSRREYPFARRRRPVGVAAAGATGGAGCLARRGAVRRHPVEVESVAWITERKNVLSLPLALLSMLAYWRFAPFEEPKESSIARPAARRWRWYAASLLLFALAALSKTVVVTLPAVLLVILWWKRGRVAIRDLPPLVPFLAVGLLLGLVTVWMEKQFVGAVGEEWSLTPMSGVVGGACALVLRHEARVALPAGVFLSASRSTSIFGGSIFFRWRRCWSLVCYGARGSVWGAGAGRGADFCRGADAGARLLRRLSLSLFVRRRSFSISRRHRAVGARGRGYAGTCAY